MLTTTNMCYLGLGPSKGCQKQLSLKQKQRNPKESHYGGVAWNQRGWETEDDLRTVEQ